MKKDGLKLKPMGGAQQRKTDWTAFDALTDEDIAAAIRNDPDVAPELDDEWFATATLVLPRAKEQISIRLDRDVLEHFRRHPRYQTRINAILRAAMEHEKKAKAG
ncbi:MAG TPA: BrnA antitoxin family protein [Stellaceae bacterium]|nr:BrnA antitoxin family protein [Stellaceae bacterium]